MGIPGGGGNRFIAMYSVVTVSVSVCIFFYYTESKAIITLKTDVSQNGPSTHPL